MRMLLLLLIWTASASVNAQTYAKKKKARSDSVQLWDGSDADVSWVNENTLPPGARVKAPLPWISIGASGGRRLFDQEDGIVLQDANHNTMSEGRFLDLIKPEGSFELRFALHVMSFVSVGAIYHLDQTRLKVNNESVAISPQELSASLQIGPRLGRVRPYAFYNHILFSKSSDRVNAPTLVTDSATKQSFDIEVEQTGGEAGLGTQLRFGTLGVFAEATQSVNRTFALNIKQGDTLFHTTAKPSYKSWQFGLSLDF